MVYLQSNKKDMKNTWGWECDILYMTCDINVTHTCDFVADLSSEMICRDMVSDEAVARHYPLTNCINAADTTITKLHKCKQNGNSRTKMPQFTSISEMFQRCRYDSLTFLQFGDLE